MTAFKTSACDPARQLAWQEEDKLPNLCRREINVICDWVVVEDASTIVVGRVMVVVEYDL